MINFLTPNFILTPNFTPNFDGDEIEINAVENRISVNLTDEDISARKAKWTRPEPRYKFGVLAKYAKLVTSASEGAVTDKGL